MFMAWSLTLSDLHGLDEIAFKQRNPLDVSRPERETAGSPENSHVSKHPYFVQFRATGD
jgi:hypothetical protein